MGINSRPKRSFKPTLRLLEARGSVKPPRPTSHLIKSTKNTSKGAELVSGPRRSSRLKSSVIQTTHDTQNDKRHTRHVVRREPESPAEKLCSASLARIYKEIDAFARQDRSKYWTAKEQKSSNDKMDAIHQFLRQARMIRSLGQIPWEQHKSLRRRLNTFQADIPVVARAVARANADWSISGDIQKRFKDFCEGPNLMILTICAHSQTFRDAIFRSDEDSQQQKLPEWDGLFVVIKSSASSLELFAQVRDLTWKTSLEHSHSHFGLLLDRVFIKPYGISDIQKESFGIKPGDLDQVHDIGLDKEPGSWIVPGGKGPAYRSRIEIVATKSTVSEFNKKDSAVELLSKLDVLQENINESVVVPGYQYPEWLKPRDNKQPSDPQFAGYENEECFVCSKKGTARSARDKTRPCKCTYGDLQRSYGQDETLFEVFDTERLGVGARALQDIKAGTFIGEYVGEVYPQGDEDDCDEWIPRYGHGLYLMYATLLNGVPKSRKRELYCIDAARLGNWTRYINHSCRPNTSYTSVNIGHRQLVLIKTTKNIKFGEELTVNYGKSYFSHIDFGCKCGMSCCRRWVEEKVPDRVPRAETLEEAKAKGTAPAWAMEDDNVPFDNPLAKTGFGLVVEGGKKRKKEDHDGEESESKRRRK